jgi:hypothetical protein
MPRAVQHSATELLVELLGPCEKEKRFDWARGDSRRPDQTGLPLPFDAVWESRRLIVEIDERQHAEPVGFFDKPGRMTVSGVHRGEQRRIYDERKGRLAREHGYTVVRIPTSVLSLARDDPKQGPQLDLRPLACRYLTTSDLARSRLELMTAPRPPRVGAFAIGVPLASHGGWNLSPRGASGRHQIQGDGL